MTIASHIFTGRIVLMRGFVSMAALAALALFIAACGGGDEAPAASTPPTEATAAPSDGEESTTSTGNRTVKSALEVNGIEGWINTDPLTISGLVSDNKVVLVDFWTYTCVNCIRTFPFLIEWHDKYSDHGLAILGIHAPEFEFEKIRANVENAVQENGLAWAHGLDNKMDTWRAFGNRYWPAKYLIGTDGQLKYSHFGEGEYVETELEIRRALAEAGYDVADIPIGQVENQDRDLTAERVTRELYGGVDRNYSPAGLYAAQDDYYLRSNSTVEYVDTWADSGEYPPQQWVINGLWRNEREAIVHARDSENLEDYIALRMDARSANVVIDPQGPEPFNVFVELDGRWMNPEEAGEDVQFDSQGRSFMNITEGRMYKVVEAPSFGQYLLKLSSDSKNFAIFAFTFGAYTDGF